MHLSQVYTMLPKDTGMHVLLLSGSDPTPIPAEAPAAEALAEAVQEEGMVDKEFYLT